jgi:glycosyltransferase involved in cell wall biosynthesis
MNRRSRPLDNSVTIAIPVGPAPHHRRYLLECLESVSKVRGLGNVLLVDDMANLSPSDVGFPTARWETNSRTTDVLKLQNGGRSRIFVYRTPWRMGVAQAFNLCVAVSTNQFTLLLGADDTIEPEVLEAFREACPFPLRKRAELTYWGLPVRYMDTGDVQTLPCNAAIVPRELWELTGGFAPEMSVGACDSMLLSVLIGNDPAAGDIRMVGEEALYNYRRHDQTDTAGKGDLQASIFQVRDVLTRDWAPTSWGRYS